MGGIQDKLSRVRKPRVHITYDVETENATIQKELPFVVGVMGNFSGNAADVVKSLKDRKFVEIDRDNFDDVMSRIEPALNLKVKNALLEDIADQELNVQLQFRTMQDFEPVKIVNQVPALKALLDARNQLRDLLTKADRSDDLEIILEKIISDKESLNQLSSDLGLTVTENATK